MLLRDALRYFYGTESLKGPAGICLSSAEPQVPSSHMDSGGTRAPEVNDQHCRNMNYGMASLTRQQ